MIPLLPLHLTYTTSPLPLDFVIPGLLAGTLGALVAPGGAGKSMFASQIAANVAGGLDTLGLGSVTCGDVLYLALEDPLQLLEHRHHAIGENLSAVDRVKVERHLHIATLYESSFDIEEDSWLERLLPIASNCRLIIIDTLRQAHSRDENDGSAMKALLSRLRRLAGPSGGSAVLFLHHTTKAAALAGAGDIQQASRGSSVLSDNVRFQMNMVGMTADQANRFGIDEICRQKYVRLCFSKTNYSTPQPDRWYQRSANGVLVPKSFGSLSAVKPVMRARREA